MITVDYNEKKNVRTTQDNMNPRIYQQEYKCIFCGEWYDDEDIIVAEDGNYICKDCQDNIDDVQDDIDTGLNNF